MATPSRGPRAAAAPAVALSGCVLVLGVLLAGCYEDPDVTVQEPGVYKGKRDPLLDKMETASLQGQLDDRFRSGQMDR